MKLILTATKQINEKTKILIQLQEFDFSITNLSESIAEVMNLSLKLATVLTSGGITMKEDFQKLLFPQGIFYNPKNGSFRTPEVNLIFRLIACQQRVSGGKQKGTNHYFDDLSPLADRTGDHPCPLVSWNQLLINLKYYSSPTSSPDYHFSEPSDSVIKIIG